MLNTSIVKCSLNSNDYYGGLLCKVLDGYTCNYDIVLDGFKTVSIYT